MQRNILSLVRAVVLLVFVRPELKKRQRQKEYAHWVLYDEIAFLCKEITFDFQEAT